MKNVINVFLSIIILISIGLVFSFFIKKNTGSIATKSELSNHSIYSQYKFSNNDSVINIGIQPLYLPTGIIFEVIKRDNILNNILLKLGKRIEYYSFLKGADVNCYMAQSKLDVGIGGDMPALSIATSFDVVIPVILQKGAVSLISSEIIFSKEFKGKRIAYSYGSISHYFILELLHTEGITENQVKLIPMEVSLMAEALHNNEIDLFAAWEPIVSSAKKQYPNFFNSYQQETTGYLYFSEQFTDRNKEASNHMLAAVIRSISWMKNDRNNLLLACEWNKTEMEKVSGKECILNNDKIAELAFKDILGYNSVNAIAVTTNDLRKNGPLNKEFQFLENLSSQEEKNTWRNVMKSFDTNMISEILKHPKIYKLNDYDYKY